MEKRPLEKGIEETYATMLIGVDTVLGGDIGQPGGGAHYIADSFPKTEIELPAVYSDRRAIALRAADKSTDTRALIKDLVDDYHLLDCRHALLEALPANATTTRRQFMGNMGDCLEVMAKTALATALGNKLPSFEERYFASARQSPEIVETQVMRDQLRAALAKRGFDTSNQTSLREAVEAWTAKAGNVPANTFATEIAKMNAQLLALTRRNIFGSAHFAQHRHFNDLRFDGLVFRPVSKVRFTASSAYAGGVDTDGNPTYEGLIEYNTDHPITNTGLGHLASHEIIPGHYADSVVADYLWRKGNIGIEGVAHTMCTAETVLREGWAQNALLVACGGEAGLEEFVGPDHEIQYWLERLQDAAKNNAAIKFQRDHVSEAELRKYLADDCALNDTYVNKLAGAWAQSPITGPMYGPAYHIGHEVVAAAIKQYGLGAVSQAVFHQHGYLDIDTFRTVLTYKA